MRAPAKRRATPRRRRNDFDNAWKEAVGLLFEDLILLFFPHVHKEIDWSRKVEFLDTTLKSIARSAKIGMRHADKLAKVFLKDGEECWLLIHIEVQSQFDASFPARMVIYHFRIREKYKKEVFSLAILADENPDWRPDCYLTSRWGCEHKFTYPIVKLNDFRGREGELFNSKNPFAHVVLAFLKTLDTKKDDRARMNWKLDLLKNLRDRGFNDDKVRALYTVIDWFMHLPDNMEEEFEAELAEIEEKNTMTHVTSWERLGVKKGKLENSREWVLKILTKRFRRVPSSIRKAIGELNDLSKLDRLGNWAITADSLKNFPLEEK